MTPQDWQKVKIIIEEALVIAPEMRAAYLAKSCGDDQDLRREVDSLLEFENENLDLIEEDFVSAVLKHESARSSAKNLIGSQIGSYRILSELGAGGMGAVFLAERADGAFSQRVALKLIKHGMDSETILRRFYTERQILASLKHPNIAHLIDGGTTDEGLPYFVLEYVEGETITDYAARENLDLKERLKLFREVCAAVSFAHSNLVIHRDLKPSNILVTKDGKVKLLDFGIAKLLKSSSTDNETKTQMHVFTPEYASPEQVKGEKLTTATDVYSLGVNLYELLTGSRPYKTKSQNIADIIKAVSETEPERPSSAVSRSSPIEQNETSENKGQRTKDEGRRTNPKSLRGDLDNIILKALRKEPERRYRSVEQLSEDIRRHLEGLPVTASKDTWSYRVSKFTQRNRVAVAAAGLILLVLLAGLGATAYQAQIARRERAKAERRFENLRKISNSLVSEIERAIRDLPGSLPARQLLLTRATEQLDALAAEADGNTDLQLELAWAYQNLGDLPDQKLSEKWAVRQKAAALAEKVLAADPRNLKARDRLAMIYLDLIYVSRLRGDVEYTVEYNRRAVETVEEILREAPAELEYKDSFWTVHYHSALTLQQLGRAAESTAAARKILPTAEELYRSEAASDGYNFMKPHLTHLQIGYGLSYAGDYDAAVREFETALADCRREAEKRPDSDILRRNEANILLQLAAALENAGDAKNALAHAENALAVRRKMAADSPANVDFQIAAADADLFVGQMLVRQNQFQTAAPRFRHALDVYEKIAAADPERMQVKILAARARASLGDTLAANGNIVEAVRHLQIAVDFYESINAGASLDAHLKRHFAEACAFLGAAFAKQKNPAAARQFYRRSLELWRDLESKGVLKHSDLSRSSQIARLLAETNGT